MDEIADRYKHEKENIIIEVGVKNSRQLFNERDPAPFRERDLDSKFVIYLMSAVEEFTLKTRMKIRILTSEPEDLKPENNRAIGDAIRAYCQYESALVIAKSRRQHRATRYFFLIGLMTLIICLSLAQFIESIPGAPTVTHIASVSFSILGWVSMWHPTEGLLYDWWPLREQRQYYDKIAKLEVEVVSRETQL